MPLSLLTISQYGQTGIKDQSLLPSCLCIEKIICRHGVPCQLMPDRGPAFLSHLCLMTETHKLLEVHK